MEFDDPCTLQKPEMWRMSQLGRLRATPILIRGASALVRREGATIFVGSEAHALVG